MNSLLLALFLAAQVGAQNMGAVTGIVRGANGMPAPGIRVYAMTVRDAAEAATAGNALESLAQTDASGRYRLEVAPGRYYIASGSVGSPTYYPGTTNVANARVISIAAGGLVENIDFSSFVPASRTPTGPGISIAPLPPGSTGVLGGTIRFQDGVAAAQMQVVAIPAAVFLGTGGGVPSINIRVLNSSYSMMVSAGGQNTVIRRMVNGYNLVQSVTDTSGRYRLENMPPETYYIATGYADGPLFFPGTSDIVAAKTFVTTPTTLLDTVDFTVPRQAVGVSVSGRVTALGGAPAAGATVQIRASTPTLSTSPFGLPTRNLNTSITVNADGTFEAPHVMPGTYLMDARALGVSTPTSRSVTVTDQPVSGIDLSVPIAVLSGRMRLEDGSALPNPQLFKEAVVTTVMNPNLVVSTITPLAADGTFNRFVEANEYRFYLGSLPDEYTIKSVTAGTHDLLKETLKITPTENVNIDIRVALRTGTINANDVKVAGSIRNTFTGLPAVADRVTLCCLNSGPTQRFSTPLRSDGSFEFAGVPRGIYALGLQTREGQPMTIVAPLIEVTGPVSGLTFQSTPQLGRLMATVVVENGAPLPATTSVVFTGTSGIRVVAERNGALGFTASVPAGDRYTVSLSNPPEGYVIKSITGSTEVPLFTQVAATGQNAPAAVLPAVTAPIMITIAPR